MDIAVAEVCTIAEEVPIVEGSMVQQLPLALRLRRLRSFKLGATKSGLKGAHLVLKLLKIYAEFSDHVPFRAPSTSPLSESHLGMAGLSLFVCAYLCLLETLLLSSPPSWWRSLSFKFADKPKYMLVKKIDKK